MHRRICIGKCNVSGAAALKSNTSRLIGPLTRPDIDADIRCQLFTEQKLTTFVHRRNTFAHCRVFVVAGFHISTRECNRFLLTDAVPSNGSGNWIETIFRARSSRSIPAIVESKLAACRFRYRLTVIGSGTAYRDPFNRTNFQTFSREAIRVSIIHIVRPRNIFRPNNTWKRARRDSLWKNKGNIWNKICSFSA